MISDINIIQISTQTTVDEFLNTFVFKKRLDAVSFLDLKLLRGSLKDANGQNINTTNRDRIFNSYNTSEYEEALNKTPGQLILKVGVEVGLPNNAVLRDAIISIPEARQAFQLTDFKPFIASELNRLLRDPKYNSQLVSSSGEGIGRVDINDITVYIWIRAISDVNSKSTGTWYNISPFIEALQTNVSKEVGSFSFSLNGLSADFDNQFGWLMDNLTGYQLDAITQETLSSFVTSKYKRSQTDNFLSRENHFFNTVLQENDLVVIRFEKLELEKQKVVLDRGFSEMDVPGNVYDMIGLIDRVGINETPNSTSISVQGRDLMKVWIEDGSYFFPEAFAQNIFIQENSELKFRNELDKAGAALISNSYSFKSIQTILKFLFNKFCGIGFVPNEALRSYGDAAIKKRYNLQQSSLKKEGTEILEEINKVFLNRDRNGVWRICDLVFDPAAGERILADNTISTDNGSIINSIRKLCQEPFVEFWGDTYGDRYNFIIRKPPFDEKGYRGMVYDNVVSEDMFNVEFSQNNRYSQSKIDQDQTLRANNGRPSTLSDLVIDIDETEVISDSFTYSDQVYSWYRVIPRGLGMRTDQQSLLLVPIAVIEEYAEIWGNKQYTIEYNYTPIEYIDDAKREQSQDYSEAQAFLDLQFVVQSHVYLPFTRQGNIKIIGNRTIKRGLFIYYKPTDEVFHVDDVTNIKTINDRFTVLRVSRGMREKYIKGIDVKFPSGVKRVSYFNIVPTLVKNDASINNKEFLKNWKADKDILNFFLQRRQWVDEDQVVKGIAAGL